MRPALTLQPQLTPRPVRIDRAPRPEGTARERYERVASSVRQILIDLGLDLEDPHLADTPRRVASMYFEVTSGIRGEAPPVLTTFPNQSDSGALVVECALPFFSMCSHHLLPFFGSAHVGYVPDAKLLGLSKFARVLEHYARRPQVQERLAEQVADLLEATLEPRGLIVVLEARHLCMEMRGVETHGATTVTTEARGILRWPEMQARFYHSLGVAEGGVTRLRPKRAEAGSGEAP